MLTEIKQYMCDRKPEEQDLIDAIIFARDWKCIVRINWSDRPYGPMHVNITPETSLTEAKRKVCKRYL
jgi:hypothetical protein